MTFRIRDWLTIFENNESRKLKTLKWVAMPNKMNTQGYTALVDHPNGAAHLGAWCALVEICSAREPRELRGTLPEADGTIRGVSRVLGRISRLPGELFEELIPRLINDPEIAWIEQLGDSSGENPEASGENPEVPAANRREGDWRGGEGTTSTPPPILPPPHKNGKGACDYPEILAAIRCHDPAVDAMFAQRLMMTITQAALSDETFPKAELDHITDENVARCVKESYRTGPPNHGTGLLLQRVPNIVIAWAKED